MSLCKNCNTEITQNYCPICGNPNSLKRIDGKYIATEIGSVLNFDKGILYTVKELIFRPGKAVKEFILEDRKRLVKPILFLIVCSVVYTIAQQFLEFEDGYINMNFDDWNDRIIGKIFNWISKNYGYANILMAVFITIWIKLFFRKYKYNHYEIFILLCFTMGISMLIFALFGIIEGIIDYPVLQYGANIAIIYTAWAIGQFFNGKKKLNYLKGILSYFLGMITFMIVVVLTGIIVEKII